MENTLNLSDLIKQALNNIFSSLFSSVDNNIYSILDKFTFIDTDIVNENAIKKLLGTDTSSGILLICNALILGFIVYYACNYLFSHLTYSKVQNPSQFIFKCIIFIALMNSSLWICEEIINLISIITNLIKTLGESTFNEVISFSNFIDKMNSIFYSTSSDFNIISFDGIIKSFLSFGLIYLLFSYSLRYIMVQIFILISPFAFICLISNNSEWFFKTWLKNFIALLLVQILISLILCLAFSLNLTANTNLSKLLFIGIIYAFSKANTYIQEIFGSISTDISSGLYNIKNLSI